MEKVDYSHINEKPELMAFPASICINVLSENAKQAQATLELIIEHLNRFDDIKVTSGELL